MVERILFAPGGATEDKQDDLLAALALLQAELDQKFESGQQVALDAATLAALETINVLVGNWPADYPLPAAQVTALTPPTPQTDALTDVELRAAPVEVSGNVDVSGPIALDAGTLAALETINAVCSGTVALDAGTLAALETITVAVSNLPAEFPLPAAQVIALTPPTPQTDALTDAELRAAEVDVADSGEREYTHVVATVTASGDTTIHTPAAGKAIRLRWIYAINQPTAASGPLIKVSLGGNEIYRVWALSKRQRVTGPVDGPLVVNLDPGGYVAVSALIEEI